MYGTNRKTAISLNLSRYPRDNLVLCMFVVILWSRTFVLSTNFSAILLLLLSLFLSLQTLRDEHPQLVLVTCTNDHNETSSSSWGERGAVLVRPDNVVAWACQETITLLDLGRLRTLLARYFMSLT